MASGIKANFGTDCKPLHAGHAARCGVEAALLAQAGFTGNPRALEHGDGFGATYGAANPPAWDLATAGLGAPHEIVDPGVGVKRFPACASTHQALDATLALAEEHALDAGGRRGRRVRACATWPRTSSSTTGRRRRSRASSRCPTACRWRCSIGRSGFAQFTDERVRRADVQALMPRVRMVIHPEQTTRECLPTRFSEVTIRLRDGRQLRRRVQQAKGQPRNPLTDAELTVKFRDCAARALPAERVGAAPGRRGAARDAGRRDALARLLSTGAR